MGKVLKKSLQLSIPLLLLIVGLYLVPVKIFHPDMSRIMGDMGDARFNNYILEHGHKYLHGEIKNFWDAPIMYPYKNVIAFSDNLLGSMPVYSFFRTLGYDRETSFQYWIIAVFALNFIFCYWALKKWSQNILLSATAAYIFAFGIYNIAHFHHVQVFPKFISPFVIYWFWKFLAEKQLKYFLFASLGLVFQFYCGIYLGFFLIYSLLFMSLAYFAVYRDWDFFRRFTNYKTLIRFSAIAGVAAILLSFVMLPYFEISKITGLRQYASIVSTIPRLSSYFFTHIASGSWYIFTQHSQFAFPDWWMHFHFVGGLPWIGIFIAVFLLFSKKLPQIQKRLISFLFLALALNILFCINIGGFSLFRFVRILPGFSSMRSLDRILNVQIIFFLFIFVFAFKELLKIYPPFKWLLFLFPLLVIIDNSINTGYLNPFSKAESQANVKAIEDNILSQYNPTYKAIAYMPVLSKPQEPNGYMETVEIHLSAMLAAQSLNIPIVNAYTGYYPGNFISFFDYMDDKSLNEWCNFNGIKPQQVQKINDIGCNVKSLHLICLKASNGKFVSIDLGNTNFLFASREHSLSWECFSMLELDNENYGFASFEYKFLSLDQHNKNGIIVNGTTIKKNETFTIEKIDDTHIAIKANNAYYLSIDENTQLVANAKSVTENAIFELIYK